MIYEKSKKTDGKDFNQYMTKNHSNGCTHHASSQTTGHQREPNEQEQPCTPYSARVRVRLLSFNTVLVDEVDDDVTEEGEDAWHPVDEGDVHGCGVVRRVGRWAVVCGENGCIEE